MAFLLPILGSLIGPAIDYFQDVWGNDDDYLDEDYEDYDYYGEDY